MLPPYASRNSASRYVWIELGVSFAPGPKFSDALASVRRELWTALVHKARRWCAYPLWFVVYLIRAEIGMPRLVIRLRTAHPIIASVF